MRTIVLAAKLYDAYQKGIYISFDADGVNVIANIGNEGTEYKHFTSILWEQISRIVVYSNFMVITVDRKYRNKVEFDIPIIFSEDIDKVSEQALYFWKRALDTKPEERKYDYATNEMQEMMEFVEQCYGQIENIRIVPSQQMKLGIAKIPPTEERDYYTLCTLGAGAYRMPIDKFLHVQRNIPKYAEYMIILPKDWPMDEESYNDKRYSWPFELLAEAAHYPQTFRKGVAHGNVFNNQDNLPYSPSLPYTSAVVTVPTVCNEECKFIATTSSGMNVGIYQLIPITSEELQLKSEDSEKFHKAIYGTDDQVIEHLLDRLHPEEQQ